MSIDPVVVGNKSPTMSKEEFKAAVQEGNLKEAASIAQQMMKSPGLFEIAVVGESGSGKSSFVNAFLGLADDDIGAAEVGMVETTEWPTLYSHPEYPNVFLWDSPGTKFPPNFQSIEHKMTDTYLSGFDFFLIVTVTRFRDIHANLARKIQENAKKFYFVHSKVDEDLGAEKRKMNYSEARTLQQIREDCQAHLQRAGVNDPQVFLLSSWESDKHDFPLLKETLDKELCHAMLQNLLDISCRTLQEKKTDMQKTTWKPATLSGSPGAIPLPGLSLADMAVLVDCMRDYCKDFGLNSDSLSALAEQVGKREEDLKAMIRSPLATEITTDLVLKLLEKCAGEGVTYLTYFAWSMPVVGSLFSAQVSFGTTVFMLDNFISDLAEDTQRVLAKALEGEEKKSKQHHQEINLPVMHGKKQPIQSQLEAGVTLADQMPAHAKTLGLSPDKFIAGNQSVCEDC